MSATPRGIVGAEIAIAFTIIASFILVFRLYTRYILVRNAGHEELAIISAWAFSVVHTSLVCFQIWHGLGNDAWDLSDAQQEHILLPFFISVPIYSIALFLTKVSILLLYLRLFPEKRFVQTCWIIIASMGAFLLWTVFGWTFMCTPLNYFWTKSVNGRCFNPLWVYFTNAPFQIITDFVLFGLPLPILRKIQLPRRQKISLVLLFGIGLCGCLTSILRLRSLYILSISTNVIYHNLAVVVWSAVEVNVGICCACGPTLKPLINTVAPHLLSITPSIFSKWTTMIDSGILSSDEITAKTSRGIAGDHGFKDRWVVAFPHVIWVRGVNGVLSRIADIIKEENKEWLVRI